MKNRFAFTLIELIFVIVAIGILSKFGVEFLNQAYSSFIYSSVNNTLQSHSATAVESIASRLQYRIKDSIIGRKGNDFTAFEGLVDVPTGSAEDYDVLEWVGSDVDGYRGDILPTWSGIIDLDASSATTLNSPQTDTTAADAMIDTLSDGDSRIENAAIYFIGSNTNIKNGYAWDGVALTAQDSSVMHPINKNAGNPDEFISSIAGVDFTNTEIFEYYQLAWTAYAVGFDPNVDGRLLLYYDYQPWAGEKYKDDAKTTILMENVSTFRFKAVGSVVKIQVCVNSKVMEDYSLCKEKTIF